MASRAAQRVLQAVIYTPAVELPRWASLCLDHCTAMGYIVFGLVVAHSESSWNDVIDVLVRGLAQVVVVARREHLPPDRVPRLEVIAEMLAAEPPASDAYRRPRLVDQEAH